jgi:hypothetical protein
MAACSPPTSAIAISPITKADCMRVRGPEMARPLSLRLPLMSVRDILMAGSKPNMIALLNAFVQQEKSRIRIYGASQQ